MGAPHGGPTTFPSERLGEPCGGTSSDGCCGSWSCCWSSPASPSRLLRDALHRPGRDLRRQEPDDRAIAEVRKQFGLDKPVPVQYLTFIKNVFLGDQYGGQASGSPTRPARRSRTSSSAGSWSRSSSPSGRADLAGHRHPRRHHLGDQEPDLHRPGGHGVRAVLRGRSGVLAGADGPGLFWFKLRWSPGTGYVAWGDSFTGWLSHMILPWIVLASCTPPSTPAWSAAT